MFKSLFQSTFSQIFLGVTVTSIMALLIAWGANYLRVIDAFARFASRQVVVMQGGEDLYLAEKLELPPQIQPIFVAYKHVVAQQFVITLFIGVGLSLLAGAIISVKITQPLAQLRHTIHHVTASGYTIRAPQKGSLEMRELIASFNRLIAELAEQERLRQDLLTDISHELNTPITKIRGQIEGMLDGIYPKADETLNQVKANLAQLEFLIDSLYAVNRLTPQEVKLKVQKCQLLPLITAATSGLSSKPIRFVIKVKPKLTILADKHRLTQILDNLIGNAYKYTAQGHITITADPKALSVSDTGMGIPAADLPRLFDRFYRVDKSRHPQYGGLGLGLFITRKLVEMHGWRLEVNSRLHHGSTLTIVWG
ncbi:hypothetical protein A2W24_05810 [Microgenomates group bacterium RBG_16_45_19]|nr:MAG: hypothetical protein A2W24_05810 [Microgenomates group bacterium RBG_16_45_19]